MAKTSTKTSTKSTKPYKKIDKIVKGVCTYFMVFVFFAWVTYWVKGDVPESLIQYGLGGSTVELVLTAAIEIFSNKRKDGD
jgi:hypothetical protein